MNDLISTKQQFGLISLLHNHNGDISIPQPYERDIFLFDTHIAGTSYVEGIEELEPQLKIDEKLNFFREPNNPYDNKAIVIKTENGTKIGYIPQLDNVIFARLMDAGKLLFGRISRKDKKGCWIKIDIKVFLHE